MLVVGACDADVDQGDEVQPKPDAGASGRGGQNAGGADSREVDGGGGQAGGDGFAQMECPPPEHQALTVSCDTSADSCSLAARRDELCRTHGCSARSISCVLSLANNSCGGRSLSLTLSVDVHHSEHHYNADDELIGVVTRSGFCFEKVDRGYRSSLRTTLYGEVCQLTDFTRIDCPSYEADGGI